ncbi:MAG: sugar phosphate isomerase/epimerase [Verrucomicrobiales bacterium]|nr:sugar phosphate isomerase/epimerase [Verrucomicrobiales bacterium]
MNSLTPRLAVCSWSLQPKTPAELVQHITSTGVKRVQLALDPLRDEPQVWGDTPKRLADAGISIASGMFGTLGEDYTTLETIKATGGIVPDATWDANWKNIQATAELAARLNIALVTFHAGFLPHDPADPACQKLTKRLRQVAEVFAARGLRLGLETGQESAETLDGFLASLGSPNVGVNFDPANMLLYDKGEPVAALRKLGRWLQQVHIKDARRTKVPGTWGEEVVVGTGEVNWDGFFATLAQLGYSGALCIEREAGNQRVADIRAAAEFLARR